MTKGSPLMSSTNYCSLSVPAMIGMLLSTNAKSGKSYSYYSPIKCLPDLNFATPVSSEGLDNCKSYPAVAKDGILWVSQTATLCLQLTPEALNAVVRLFEQDVVQEFGVGYSSAPTHSEYPCINLSTFRQRKSEARSPSVRDRVRLIST